MAAVPASRLAVGVLPSTGKNDGRLCLHSHQGLRLASSAPKAELRAALVPSATPSKRTQTLTISAAAAGVAAAPVAVLPVLKFDGAPAGEAELSLKTARAESAKGLVHRAVITYLQNKRRGTASTLTRAEVRGGGRKPFKQKGTGNARQGSRRTPLRPGGGVVFGPKPTDWTIKMNKKERRLAVGTALQSSAVNMTIVEDIEETDLPLPKTRDFVAALERWGVDYKKDNTLFVTAGVSKNVELASRNIQKLKVADPFSLNVYDVLRADKLVVTLSGLALLNRKFGGEFEGEDGEDSEGDTEVLLRLVGGNLVLGDEDAEEEGTEGPEEGDGDASE